MNRSRNSAWSTAFLAVLVSVSLVLSGLLWFSPDGRLSASRPGLKVQVRDLPNPMQLMTPRQIVAHLGRDAHVLLLPGTALYDQAWSAARQVLGHVETAGDVSPSAEELETFHREQGLELTFEAAAPLGDWLWVWRGAAGIQMWPPTRHILLVLGRSPQVLLQVDGENRWARAPLTAGADGVLEALRQVASAPPSPAVALPAKVGVFDVAPGLFVPAEGLPVTEAHLIPDPLKPDVLARSLFPDMSVVRRIKERDGADIYTDGAKWLRVYASGQSEYSAPASDSSGTVGLSEALGTVIEFVTLHGGWLLGSTLTEAGQEGGQYRIGFGLRFNGLPLVQSERPLQLTVTRHGVIAYRRGLMAPQGPPSPPSPAISAVHALEVLSAGKPSTQGTVVDMYLGYVRAPGNALKPAWVVDLATGQRLAVNAVTGKQVPVP